MSLLALSLIHLVAVASPGPGFAVLFHHTITYSFKSGVFTAIGIACGDLALILISVFGAGYLVHTNPEYLRWIQLGGAAYLTYLGFQGLKTFFRFLIGGREEEKADTHMDFANHRKSFMDGFVTTLGNPKAIVYFISISSQVMRPGQTYTDLTVLILTLVFITGVWFSVVAFVIGNKKVRPQFMKYRYYIDGLMGLVLVLYGVYFLMNK
ncbi:MAG: LysE family translocator [Bdellovibrionota bacterium]